MQLPDKDHPIHIAPARRRMRASFLDHVIADSDDVLVLSEAGLPPVAYFPREDVAMSYLARTDRLTYCAYKGEASYYTLMMDGVFAENAVWTYEAPFPSVGQIAGRLAFYPDKVRVYQVEDDEVAAPRHPDVDEVVQHTDSGAGDSQKPRWPPNVRQPED